MSVSRVQSLFFFSKSFFFKKIFSKSFFFQKVFFQKKIILFKKSELFTGARSDPPPLYVYRVDSIFY